MSSSMPLLTTKLYLPPARRNLVLRSRLTSRLGEGLTRPLTLISAPAGYGKTTLLAQYIADCKLQTAIDQPSTSPIRSPQSTICNQFAWLSLDEADNDTARFLTYLCAALAGLKPGFGATTLGLLETPQPPPPQAILTSLINELSEIAGPFAVVLDDCHVLVARPIHEALTFLLDHLPPQMRLAMLTRADPPLPLARLRVRDQLTEIRAADLRFTNDETAAFLNRMMGLALSAEQIAALEQRTEGWIAGLQLAALSAQGRSDLHAFVAAFAGSHRYIVDYLVEEVLNRQPAEVQVFLLHTSILERFCGELCDAILKDEGGRRKDENVEPAFIPHPSSLILDYLDRANLFLVPLDDERHWYRYHPLFAEMLASRLRQVAPELLSALHRRAGEWYEQHGLVDAAISHALAVKDWSRAVALMGGACQAAMQNGEIGKVFGWGKALPEEAVCENLALCINYAWAVVLTGQFEMADKLLARIEGAAHDHPDQLVEWLAVRAYAARAQGQMRQAMELAQRALAIPGSRSVDSQSILALSLTLACWHIGRIAEAGAMAARAVNLAEQAGNRQVWAFMMAMHARAQAAQGHLRQAAETYRREIAGRPAARPWLGSGASESGLAALYYEWNDLEQAADYVQAGLKYAVLTGHSEVQMSCHRLAALICQAQGDRAGAWEALVHTAEVARKGNLGQMMVDRVAAERAQIALAQGDLAAAAEWMSQVEQFGAAFHYPHLPLERAMLNLAQGDKAAAAALLAERYQAASQDHLGYAQVEIRILQALAADDEKQSLAYLADALTWAEPEGYIRVFVDKGEAMRAGIRDWELPISERVRSGEDAIRMKAYTAKLLAAFGEPATTSVPQSPIPNPQSPLVEPLTDRELEVLHLLAAGRSNQEIADALVVALGTVKKHLNNIFGKLGVESRTRCVARARELNLI